MNVCKLCLRQSPACMPLTNFEYREMIKSLTNNDVNARNFACPKCISNLKLAYNIQQGMMRALRGLQNRIKLETDSIKIEEVIINEPQENITLKQLDIGSGAPICGKKCIICSKIVNVDKINDHIKKHFECEHGCEPCSKKFNNFNNYRTHTLNHHQNDVHECKQCRAKFRYKSLYNVHIEKAHKKVLTIEKKIKCTTKCYKCNEIFRDEKQCKLHINLMRKCYICRKIVCLGQFVEHRRQHDLERHKKKSRLMCEICGASLSTRSTLRVHMQYLHKPIEFKCKECGKVYKQRMSLQIHKKKEHVGVATFVCEICGKGFFRSPNLTRHINTKHKKLQPNICQYCNKSFSCKKAMKRHERQHTNETPYKCQDCGMAFKHNVSLRGHKKTKHGIVEVNKFPCKSCEKQFASQYALETHVYRTH